MEPVEKKKRVTLGKILDPELVAKFRKESRQKARKRYYEKHMKPRLAQRRAERERQHVMLTKRAELKKKERILRALVQLGVLDEKTFVTDPCDDVSD